MARFRFYLDEPGSDSPTRILLSVHWNARRLKFPTGRKVLPDHWSDAEQRATMRTNKQTHEEVNGRLDFLRSVALATVEKFARDFKRPPEREELRRALLEADNRAEGESPLDLFGFAQRFIDSEEGRFNTDRKTPLHKATVSRYRVTLDYLKEYSANRSLRNRAVPVLFTSIDPEFVNGFVVFLTKEKGFAANTVTKYGRTLRLFLKRAKEQGHEVSDRLFTRKMALREEESEQVYLTPEELDALFRLDLSAQPRLERARDLFLVGAWTGLRFGDLSRIRPEHIEGDRIHVTTSKTRKQVGIPLHPVVRTIMAKYGGRIPSGISNQKQNDYLKEAASKVPALQAMTVEGRTVAGARKEIARPKWQRITTHTARRSFASNLYRDGQPARSIMALTGHTTEQSFFRYIRLKEEEHMDMIARSNLFKTPALKAV